MGAIPTPTDEPSGGKLTIKTRLLSGNNPEDLGFGRSRWMARSSFRTIRIKRAARFVATLWRGDGRAFKLEGREDDTVLGGTSLKNLAGFTENPLSQIATDGFLVRGTGPNVVVGLVVDGSLVLADVPDEGKQPITLMTDGPATAATGCAAGDGTFWALRVEGGTVKATLRNVKDLSIVDGPFTTNLSGLSDEARIDADHVALERNQPGILLLVTDGGTTSPYVSPDGKTFS